VDSKDALVTPRKGRTTPEIGPVAVLCAAEADLNQLRSLLGFGSAAGRRLFTSRLFTPSERHPDVSLAGPMIGAPYAAMVLETLIAWGARRLFFLGWCGALTENLVVGDLLIPTAALIDEGTSRHYLPGSETSAPAPALASALAAACAAEAVAAHRGPVWTTDAVYRETREKVLCFQQRGALAVEMEASVLFSIGSFRGVDVAALLTVSDELSTLSWKPGFKDPRFAAGRKIACRVVGRACATPEAA
jgi:purine-nucleoside phosphorylase